MVSRKTRLKPRVTPQSKGGKVSKGVTSTPARKKTTGSFAGRSRVGKGTLTERTSPRMTPKRNVKNVQKPPARTGKTNAATGTNKKSPQKDEYEFDGTDDDSFTGHSMLSTSFSASNLKKPLKKDVQTNVKSSKSKSSLTNQQKGKKGKQKTAQSRRVGSRGSKEKTAQSQDVGSRGSEKTSTPLSEVVSETAQEQPGKSRGKRRQYLQVALPKLDLDISVTPILPISSDKPLTARASPRSKARKNSVTKSVSFEDDRKEPVQTPAGKINKKTQRQLVVAKNLSNIAASGSFKEPAPTSTSAEVKTDRKRKTSEASSSTQSRESGSTPEKRKKVDLAKTTKNLGQSGKVIESRESKPTKKATTSLRARKPSKPVTFNPVLFSDEELVKKKQAKISPPAYDSGISMGEDTSTSGDSCSAQLSLPGFMEDEPMHCSLDHFDDSPLSAPVSFSSSGEASVYKSSAKEYKPAKTKRVKGRYSTSKVDAWASAMNQSFQDVEGFELVVE